MKPTRNWDNTKATYGGNFERLTPGPHACQIVAAKTQNSRSGKEMLVLALEIHEGSAFDGMMRRRFERNNNQKWPNDGTLYQLTADERGDTSGGFKGVITAIEESNTAYKWNWNEAQLAGKMIGVVFREEEYEAQNSGEIRTSVKPMYVCSIGKLSEQNTPSLKKLNPLQTQAATMHTQGFEDADQDDTLPF